MRSRSLVAQVAGLVADDPSVPVTRTRVEAMVRAGDPLLGPAARRDVVDHVLAAVTGMGPLERLLADPAVTDVLVNGPGPVWIERDGRLRRLDLILDEATILGLIERVVAPLGLQADRSCPMVDARLPDGSRVHVVLPPLAVDGPCLTIRRFATKVVPLEAFCAPDVARFLAAAVRARQDILVSGGTGAGKTTLLNALAAHVPAGERLVTIEDAAELRLPSDHVVRLEARPANADGVGCVGIRDLVRGALRMRPDRIIVGEVRGGEALDMVQAMHTGHEGSLGTVHANSPEDALRRVETMILLGAPGLAPGAVREFVRSALDLVVHVERADGGGGRRVAAVAEVADGDGPFAVRPVRFEPEAQAS